MTATASSQIPGKHKPNYLIGFMNMIVLILSVLLIVWISLDTFKKVNFLENHAYMTFQLWVCIIFVLDFFVELRYSHNKWRFVRHRLVFLFLSIPYLNIISLMNIHLTPDALYFVRFIPLARGALALSIVISYLSSNAVTSLFMSYLSIRIFLLAHILSERGRSQSRSQFLLDSTLVVGHEYVYGRMRHLSGHGFR